ncbi:MAG TPA: WXG100 family type VII secretion target [Candidatus Dormibacteraeota bacterium]|nr:WXG100 family type VII secretion target [Candidatus Dormibacteraeota bacterium]
MPAFRVDTAVLAQKSAAIQALVPELQSLLAQHHAQMQNLFTVWKGQSATGFQGVHVNLHQSFQQLHQNLGVIGQNLGVNNANYLNADVASTPR